MTDEELREARGDAFRAVSISRLYAIANKVGAKIDLRQGMIVEVIKRPHPQDYGKIVYSISHHLGSRFAEPGSVEAHTDLELMEKLREMLVKMIEAILSGMAPR